MDPAKLAECVIRIDERLKKLSEDFHELRDEFVEVKEDTTILRTKMTNHLYHHEKFEKTIPSMSSRQLVGYTGGTAALDVAGIEIIFRLVGGG